ncbi:MAG: glycine--tRNA ligase [Candidatus Woesearchaeota archaeon]
MTLTIDEMATFCKKKGFVYPNSEIYGGMAGFFDYGPLGVEMKNNIKKEWWKFYVQEREDVVGIDGSIVTHPKVWIASGHIGCFSDIFVECKKCHSRHRADQLVEDALKIATEGMKAEQLSQEIQKHKLKCPACKGDLSEPSSFNLMFKTYVGPRETAENVAYLRPETAQLMFADFKHVVDTARVKLPFGIAQIGKAFRNEVAPRNFLFRCREFEQMEIEYFIHPKKYDDCPYIEDVIDTELVIYSAEMQIKNQNPEKMRVKDALKKSIIKSPWHAFWLAKAYLWFTSLGAKPENFRIRQHKSDEKAHYSKDCWDLEYKFPFGFKELQGIADRADFDLQQHIKHSGKDLSLFDEEYKEKVVPHVVAEPSLGVDRTFLVFMFDAYEFSKERGNVVLHLHPSLAPVKVLVAPLVNKLDEKAKEVYEKLRKNFVTQYDRSGSIGRRYARADEIGIPIAVTIDFDTLNDDTITLRDRETTKQARVKISELVPKLHEFLSGTPLEKLGKIIN